MGKAFHNNDTLIKDSFSIDKLNQKFAQINNKRYSIYNQIVLIKNGNCSFKILDNTIEVADSELILIPKNEIYEFCSSEFLNGFILSFGDCIWERTPSSINDCKAVLFEGISFRRLKLNDESFKTIESIMNILLMEFENTNYINKVDVLAAYLKIIMIKIANIHKSLNNAYSDHDKQLYYNFLKLVKEKSSKRLNVNEYVNLLCTTPKKLTAICNSIGETTPKNIIDNSIISSSKHQLMFSSIPIKEIATNLNFNSVYQFSHFFKNHTKFSPKEYRMAMTQIDK